MVVGAKVEEEVEMVVEAQEVEARLRLVIGYLKKSGLR